MCVLTLKLPIAPMGKMLTRLPRLTLAQLPTLRSTTECTCCRAETLLAKFPSKKVLHACLDSRLHNCGRRSGQLQGVRAAETFCEFPIAPMGFSHVCARMCLQGGGVAVSGGTVSFSSCTITGNTATGVRAHAQNFPSPRWDFHMFWTCACRVAVLTSVVAR
jgi:hypothetical protein